MRLFFIAFLIALQSALFAQDKLAGNYRDNFGSQLQINSNGTFKYNFSIDGSSSWTIGTWNLIGDTVYLHMVPVYDTVTLARKNNIKVDSLILSTDEISERYTNEQFIALLLSSGGQNTIPCPDKLVFKKGKLYKIQNGRLITKKQKGFSKNKKVNPWFSKWE